MWETWLAEALRWIDRPLVKLLYWSLGLLGVAASIWGVWVTKRHSKRADPPLTLAFPPQATARQPVASFPAATGSTTRYPGLPESVVHGATESGREPFFINAPCYDMPSAIAASKKAGKDLFAVFYDSKHSRMSQVRYQLGAYLDHFESKQRVEEEYVTALIDRRTLGADVYLKPGATVENSYLLILTSGGETRFRDRVYANGDVGAEQLDKLSKGDVFSVE